MRVEIKKTATQKIRLSLIPIYIEFWFQPNEKVVSRTKQLNEHRKKGQSKMSNFVKRAVSKAMNEGLCHTLDGYKSQSNDADQWFSFEEKKRRGILVYNNGREEANRTIF